MQGEKADDPSHKLSFDRQIRSEIINSERRQQNYLNYGEKLYARGMRRKFEKQIFIERAKSEQDK